tara:strand:+ start:83 stop:301 length:219 start_codon:yes stop_codon:yes gene_type:complete
MRKNIFHNGKSDKFKSRLQNPIKIEQKKIVDINILLNKVKIDQQIEIKQKVIFCSFGIFLLSFMGIFILVIK